MKTKISLFAIITLFLLSCKGQNNLIEIYEKPNIQNSAQTDVFFAIENEKAGWMNVLGEWVIPPVYDIDFTGTWHEGTVVVKKNGKYGVINYKNEVILPFEYDEAPSNTEKGLIVVSSDDGRYGKSAYFSKKGNQLSDFMNPLFEFNNGFAVITSNRKKLGSYPRIDLPDSENRTTEIWTSDFVLINTNFDTILSIQNSPFLIDLGSLNQNLRSFIIYPYMAQHADRGLSYGIYGYLNEEGEIKIEPKFKTLFAFEREDLNFVHTRDFPFISNRSLVIDDLNKYSFIDNSGKKVIEKKIGNRTIMSTSHFNDFGLAVIRSGTNQANNSMTVHIIDATGQTLFESDESIAYLGFPGNIASAPENLFLTITDRKNQELKLYSPSFDELGTFPLKDEDFKYFYRYNDIQSSGKTNKFYLLQERNTSIRNSPLNQKRVISESGNPLTNWVSLESFLSYKYGVYSISDSINEQTTFYDFSRKELFTCSACTYQSNSKLDNYGVYKVYQKDGTEKIISFKGTVLSDLFTSMNENIVSLEQQIEEFNKSEDKPFKIDKSLLIDLFNKSEMSNQIRK